MGKHVAVGLLALTVAASGQETTPTFRSETRLVEVSVTAVGAKGQPVVGLTREELRLTAGGRERPIAFLHFDGAAGEKKPLQPMPKFVYTNRPEFQRVEARNVTAIVIDTLNSGKVDDMRVRAQVLKYLRALPEGTRVALYQLGSSLRVLHDFTDDAEALRAKVRSVSARRLPGAEEDLESLGREADSLSALLGDRAPAWRESMEMLMYADREQAARMKTDRMETAFRAMIAVARHMGQVPGRKNLVWAGGGLPLIQVVGNLAPGPHNRTIVWEEWIQKAGRELAAANVVMYYYDTRGVIAPGNHAAQSQTYQATTEAQRISEDARLGTSLLARKTGGRYVNYSNSVETALETVEADQRASYTLGFYADATEAKGWTPIEVKAKREGVKLQHRDGFQLGEEAAGSGWDEAALRGALANPLGASSVMMNARCEPDPEARGGLRLFLQLDAETIAFEGTGGVRKGVVEVTVAEMTAEGRVYPHTETARLEVREREWARTVKEGVPYLRRWKPRADAVRLRILARDAATGQLGTLDVALKDLR